MKCSLQKAYTLLECMISLSCTTLLSLSIFMFISDFYRMYHHVRKKNHESISMNLVRDVIRRDLFGASCHRHDYAVTSKRTIFKKYWLDQQGKKQTAWVEYYPTQKGFARCEGVYDTHSRRWGKKVVSYLPACFREMRWKLITNPVTGTVKKIRIVYHSEQGNNQRETTDQFFIQNGYC